MAKAYAGEADYISDHVPAAAVVRNTAIEMGFDEAKVQEFLLSLESEAVSTVSDLRLLEVTHWKELRIPFGLANRIKSKIKRPVPTPSFRRTIMHHDGDDDDTNPSNIRPKSPHISPRSDPETSPLAITPATSPPSASTALASTIPTTPPSRALRIGDRGRPPVRAKGLSGAGWVSASPLRNSMDMAPRDVTVSAALAQLDLGGARPTSIGSAPNSPEPQRMCACSFISPL